MTSSNKTLERDTNAEDIFKKQATIKYSTFIKERPDQKLDLFKDFCVASKLDRDLLLGVFEDHTKLQKVVKGLSDKAFENLQFKTYS